MQTPRIVIDARMIGPQGHGIANYLCDIVQGLRELARKKPLPYELFFLVSPDLPKDHFLRSFPLEVVGAPFLSLNEIFALPKILKRLDAKLYFSPSFSSLPKYPCPHVQTIHDLNHLTYGGALKKIYYEKLVRPSALSSAALFSVSLPAAREISAWLDTHKKIEITYNAMHAPEAISAGEETSILQRFQLEKEKYFFTLSNAKPHKNLEFLIRTHQKFAKENKDAYPLVLSIDGTSKDKIIKTGSLSQKDLQVLLKNTAAFFFPSLYEGFGRPPLEAALFERVLVASKIPPLEEALTPVLEKTLLDPKKEKEWVDAFQKAQKKELAAVSHASRERVLKTYSLEKLAQVVDEAFRRCHS